MADIPLDLVNPGAVELVLEIRREYAKKLEEVIFPFILVDGVWLTSYSFLFSIICSISHSRCHLIVGIEVTLEHVFFEVLSCFYMTTLKGTTNSFPLLLSPVQITAGNLPLTECVYPLSLILYICFFVSDLLSFTLDLLVLAVPGTSQKSSSRPGCWRTSWTRTG